VDSLMDALPGPLRHVLLQVLRDLTAVSPRTVHLVAVLLIMCGCWVVVARSRPPLLLAWVALTVASLVWLRVNQHDEGRILYAFSPSHGVTEADLLVPTVVGAAVVLRAIHLALLGHRGRPAARR
jgi:hypothetical protein